MSRATIIRAISLDIEAETGYDSVPTIESFQLCDDDAYNSCDEPCGRYHCVWPRCEFKSRHSHIIWLHEMFNHPSDEPDTFLGWTQKTFHKEFGL